MEKVYYLTTPLYYVNDRPHIGHSYTNILCDTFTRYHRYRGEKVFFLTGTDEHGGKIEKMAREKKKDVAVYVDEMVPRFKDLWTRLGIEYDDFIRTTEDRHKKVVAKVLTDLQAKGDVYRGKYKGWYCTPCESFWTGLQLRDGNCPDCNRTCQELEEENFFFKLSKYQSWLIQYISSHDDFIFPSSRRKEVLAFLEKPLEDLCISRPKSRLSWGIPFPDSPDHVVYVWFDALTNYISAVGFGTDPGRFETLWPADLHVVGKDILRQHTVYWPIMLRALELPIPQKVLAHGWWTIEGAKVSKSLGNIVDPAELARKYGVDALRYFLLREVTLGLDGAFSEDLLAQRYTSDLANNLGNLWFRLATMLEKYFEGRIPEGSGNKEFPKEQLGDSFRAVVNCMNDYDPRGALACIWGDMTAINQRIEEKKPWELAKDPSRRRELAATLALLAEWMAHIAVLLLPFLPTTARKILERLKLKTDWILRDENDFSKSFLQAGTRVDRGEALFPRLEEEKASSA